MQPFSRESKGRGNKEKKIGNKRDLIHIARPQGTGLYRNHSEGCSLELHAICREHPCPHISWTKSCPEGTPTSHYRLAETRVGRRWRGSLPNADLGESLVKGEIEGLDPGHGVWGWWVAEPFSEKSGAHLDKQVHRLIVEPPAGFASHWRVVCSSGALWNVAWFDCLVPPTRGS